MTDELRLQPDDGGEEVEALRRWLRSDDDIRSWTVQAEHGSPTPGYLGTITDTYRCCCRRPVEDGLDPR
ncbi:hypothetical protein GCM10009827_001850 [Dactylosporangium maewongense]|uniref:Uncharacterized protein n=1 Tax=Dactylosporangium maewongense TaxID=634393 RepID=A0ABN1ZHZ6_9ACTN